MENDHLLRMKAEEIFNKRLIEIENQHLTEQGKDILIKELVMKQVELELKIQEFNTIRNKNDFFPYNADDRIAQKQEDEENRNAIEISREHYLLFQSLLENPEGMNIFSLDRHFNYKAFSFAHKISMKKIWGVDIEPGIKILDLMPIDKVRERAKGNFELCMEGRNITIVQAFYDEEKNTTFWEDRYVPVHDKENGIIGLIAYVTEITERVQNEKRLYESREKLNAIFKNSADGIVLIDENGEIREWNPGSEKISGFSLSEVFGKKVWDIQYQLSSDQIRQKWTVDAIKKLWTNQFLVLREHETKTAVGAIVDKQGVNKVVEDLISPVFLNNQRYVVVIQRDITARKQVELALKRSEEKYKSIIENLTDIYYRADITGKLVMASPSCLKSFGYSSMDEVIGQNLEIIYKDPAERSRFIQLLKQNGKVKNYRTVLSRSDGSEIYVETTANILLDKEGNYEGVEGIVRDITDRLQAEKALTESEGSLREINATKDKLFSIIAHDLKSPFTSILGFSELLSNNLRKYSLEETNEYIDYINTSAKNTLALLENLLAWAKSQTGQLIYRPVKLEIFDVAREIIAVFDATAKIKNISLVNHPSNRIELITDQNILQTVLRNLVSNAIKYSFSNGKVGVESRKTGNMIEIQVTDEGIGIDKELQDSLFRIDKNIVMRGTANEKGSGLGLLICKELVEKLGGQIWVESEKGRGSMFKFTIPLGHQ